MPTITITGNTTQEALEEILYQGIGKYGKGFNVQISENLRFENQNKQIKALSTEFEKLLMMLSNKFPEAYKHYKDHLRPVE